MLICLDQRSGMGCHTHNHDQANFCKRCGRPLRYALAVHNPGTLIGHYRIVGLLGHGGFGAVYEAEDRRQAGLHIALKETYERDHVRSFRHEFDILRHLQHPNLPRYIDMFEEKWNGYLAMELVPGQSLGDLLSKAPLQETQVLGYAVQICATLSYLHNCTPPILHRDIKPDNIRLTPEGLIKLVDFGLVKVGDGRTRSSRRALTPNYAPLEQWGSGTDACSDLYSLGATLYHLLTGQLPTPAPERLATSPDPLALPQILNPKLSAHVAAAIMKAMSLRQAERYPDVMTFQQALLVAPAAIEPLKKAPLPTANALTQPMPPQSVPGSSQAIVPNKHFYSLLPDLARQGMKLRIGRGIPRQVIPLDDEDDEGDERVLLIAAGGATLFDMPSGQTLWEIDCPATCGALSPDGKRLALGSYGEIYLWDLQTGQRLHTLRGHRLSVTSVAFSSKGLLASASRDRTVRLWDMQGRELRVLKGHNSSVNSVAFSPTGILASASSDKTVRLWDRQGRERHVLKGHRQNVSRVAFSPTGTLASASWDKTVRLWDMQGCELHVLQEYFHVHSVAFSPTGILASTSSDARVRLWDMQGGLLDVLEEHTSSVKSVAFSSTGTLASVSYGEVRLWDTQGRKLLMLEEYSHDVTSLAFSPTGTLACASSDENVRLWDMQGRELRTLKGHNSSVTSVAFSPTGLLASASHDKSVRLWDMQGNELRTLQGHTDWVKSVAFSPTGILASASDDKTVRLWDMQRGQLHVLTGHTNWVLGVAFSPTGILASASRDETVRLWDMQGNQLHILKGHTGPVNSVAFSPTGMLASASYDKSVRLWNMQGRQLHILKGHTSDVNSVAFNPDGRILASASNDGTVRLWNIQGRELRTLKGHSDEVKSVAFSPDGPILASAGDDGIVRLWDVGKAPRIRDGAGLIYIYPHWLRSCWRMAGEDVKSWWRKKEEE